ncbi:MAG: Zn-ribbon domain-containing protein [Halobacteriales archaeon]
MPHQCTGCGRRFPDGSTEMLGGCPDCGGKKFQFQPNAEAPPEDAAQTAARSEVVPEEHLPRGEAVDAPAPEPEAEPAREAPAERPTLAELREELDDQFESIKIVEPGQYELNLMELYDRETYIISLQEDGRYVIEVPEAWREGTGST